jgi:hypothetical protein
MADDIMPGDIGGVEGTTAAPGMPRSPAADERGGIAERLEFLADKTKTAALMAGEINASTEWRNRTNSLYQPPEITAPRDEVRRRWARGELAV